MAAGDFFRTTSSFASSLGMEAQFSEQDARARPCVHAQAHDRPNAVPAKIRLLPTKTNSLKR